MICDKPGIKCYYLKMADYHFSLREEMEGLTQWHIQCHSISGQEFGDEKTLSTNVATAMEKLSLIHI